MLLTVIAGCMFYTDTFIAYGWVAADINGNQLLKSSGHSIPSPWSCEVIDTNATKVLTSASAGRKANNAGTTSKAERGSVLFSYKLKTDRPTGFLNDLEIRSSLICYATASGTVSWGNSSGKARGDAQFVSTRTIAVTSSITEDEATAGPKTVKHKIRFPNQTWNSESDGTKSMTFTVNSPVLTCAATATSSGGGGNYFAVSTTSSPSFKFYPTGISIIPSGSSGGMLSGSTNALGTNLLIDVYNSNGVPLDNYAVNIIDGTWSMTFDEFANGTYRLYAHTKGALRKRCDISWDSTSGLSGVTFTLKYGDLDDDGYVSQAEADFIYAKIGQSPQSGNWMLDYLLGDINQCWNPDLNGDGTVTIADYNLAYPNIGQYGDS